LVIKLLFLLIFSLSTLFGSLHTKSAMVYYGGEPSYSMVGIHDYIILQPDLVDEYTHGFKLYKKKIYAYVSIGEIHPGIKQYPLIKKEWVLHENKAWKSKVLDISNKEYQQFLFTFMIEPLLMRGFENFFFDTLDSYQLVAKTPQQRENYKKALINFIHTFHKKYPHAKLILNRGFELIDAVHNDIEAVLFESYFLGLGGTDLGYKIVSKQDREWLDIWIKKIQSYNLDVISLDYIDDSQINSPIVQQDIDYIASKGMIPVVSNRELNIYSKSSKNAIKREIFTLIDESKVDRIFQSAHRHGDLVLNYLGYIQNIHDIHKGLPPITKMLHYAGVIIWLEDVEKTGTKELFNWILQLIQRGIKVTFVETFAGLENTKYLKKLGIKYKEIQETQSVIGYKDELIGFEIDPSTSMTNQRLKVKGELKKLLVMQLANNKKSTLAAIMPWGGFAFEGSFLTELQGDELFIMNPFLFFQESLHLKKLLVPDNTTQNGTRLMFSHIDGDGMINRVEATKNKLSGDVILNKILKRYKTPHSVSVIGAEIDKNGLFPALANRTQRIAKYMYALSNVEPATHTFTHPFFWSKIVNDSLPEQYRLKVKGYHFSMENELTKPLEFINKHLLKKGKKPRAKTVFWSGDCAPKKEALAYTYKHNILNINGGDTTITNDRPWLANIAPIGLKRGNYYQVYTGQQNENIYTNEWLGPFWGFKKVVQTFKLTNSPRRFKPIDIYYHLYSGSKVASLRALEYVFNWTLKQDILPIFTSEYIPKVMDFYEISMANEGDEWLFEGMRNLKTLRIEQKDAGIDFKKSQGVVGLKHFETHTYLHIEPKKEKIFVTIDNQAYKKQNYLESANAKLIRFKKYKNYQEYRFEGYLPLKVKFHLQENCSVTHLSKRAKKGTIKLFCK